VIRPLITLAIVSSALAEPAPRPIDFSKEIRPIQSENCFFCHGPDDKKREADLRLDDEAAAKKNNDGVIAVVPGNPEKSALIERIVSTDPDEVMPPPKQHKTISPSQIALLKEWIKQGAKWGKHWSYEKVVRPAVPTPSSKFQVSGSKFGAVDAFLAARLEKEGLSFSPVADRATLIRRVALDLTGLPPTLEELARFSSDKSATSDLSDVVSHYLAKPSYGEHWAAQWLDLARYADSSGYPSDQPREIWAYRDWVIRALNSNMPFDQFTIEQNAGDLLPNPTDDQLIATAFHRNTMTQNEGGTDDEEFRNAAVIDRVNTTFAVWMGTTMANFWQSYLNRSRKSREKKNKAHIIFCPTDEWHREADLWRMDDPLSETKPILTGFFYLPGRVPGSANYSVNGVEHWITRKKMGGPFKEAPVMMDRLQGQGSWAPRANRGSVTWTVNSGGKNIPTAVHRDKTGAPSGGNFLFEDGHVSWYRFNQSDARNSIDLGATVGNWLCFYKIRVPGKAGLDNQR
jgi:hypothetical protein